MSCIPGIFTYLSEWNSKSTLCRLCMKDNDSYYNIFTSNIECQISVEDVLLDLVGLKISVGDGLPTTMCPLCLENLTKFRVFKKICLESDEKLRKISSRHCFRSIQGDGAADVKVESSDETKDCIQDAVEGASKFACSVQTTEIYIPVPDSQHPRGNALCTVKEENEQLLSEGNYPAFNSPNTAGISSEASDPLATHDLCNREELLSEGNHPAFNSPNTAGISSEASDPLATHDSVSTASRIREADAGGRGAIVADINCMLVGVKKEPSEEENDDAEPNFSETGERIETWTMGNECRRGTLGFPATDGLPVQPTSAIYLLEETNARIDLIDDYIAPSSSLTLTEFKTEVSDGGDGRNVADEDLEECGALNADKIIAVDDDDTTINDNGQYYRKCIPMSKSSGGGTTSTDVGIRGGCDGPNTVDTIRSNFILDGKKPCSKSSSSKSKNKGSIGSTQNDVCSSAAERPYACSVCYKTFPQRGKLNDHMLTHTEGKPFSCSVCGKHYKYKKTLNKHTRLHTGENIYVCNECEMPFFYKGNLARHMQTHMAEKPFSCSLCSKTFTTRNNLNCHLRSHAKVKPTHSCRICQESFSLVWQLEEHMRVHPGEKTYACSECKKSFSTKGILSKHMRSHSREKPYQCSFCGRSFDVKKNLECHMHTHTRYACSVCGKCFTQRCYHEYHMRRHRGEKPFSCCVCGKAFYFQWCLNKHMRTH
ncbi:zinc finger protein 35-like isoform X2 [Ischnura elegans]|uniref:zinc finger protein 35-like isoform X2 n=1 Tax=Ischnura elegans TaxID=197161 RepID=UPI001ED87A9E|nr:zinc finger protein 35-like isoform X2 [Ischnura elegans]